MSKSLIGLSILLLVLPGLFGVLNVQKSRSARAEIEEKESARQSAENRRFAQEKELKARETKVSEASAKFAETENKIAAAEAELAKAKTEKALLADKIRAVQERGAQLEEEKKRRVVASSNPAFAVPFSP